MFSIFCILLYFPKLIKSFVFLNNHNHVDVMWLPCILSLVDVTVTYSGAK